LWIFYNVDFSNQFFDSATMFTEYEFEKGTFLSVVAPTIDCITFFVKNLWIVFNNFYLHNRQFGSLFFGMVDPVCCIGGATSYEKLDPRWLACDRNGIPFLSRREIENVAVGFLWELCPWVVARPAVTPVLDILDQLKLQTGLTAKFAELGRHGTAKIVGRLNFPNRLLLLDFSLTHERESGFRFTLAYQIGHWVLHRDNFHRRNSPDIDTQESVVESPLDGLFPFRRRTPEESLEFQARSFAAALLMPHRTFAYAFSQLRQEFGLSMDSARGNLDKIVLCLSEIFQVSKTCVRIRIEELKLLAQGAVLESLTDAPQGKHESAPVDQPAFA
jgi:hypothetical protein